MGRWWIKFGCFLTGHNYRIIKNSSEIAAKSVKRYTSAIMIICIIWSFVGFMFTSRYLKGDLFWSIAGAIIMVIIVIQIERQIILSINPSKWLYLARGVIAVLMAIIGAAIVDQIIFKEDIDLEKITSIEERVKEALPPKTQELRLQIAEIDSILQVKEVERTDLIKEITKNPTIPTTTTEVKPQIIKRPFFDSTSGQTKTYDSVVRYPTVIRGTIPNPKQGLIVPLDQTISDLRKQKVLKENDLVNVRPKVEAYITSKTGFLDELSIMVKLISKSKIALTFWFIWLIFLFSLEILVLVSKMKEKTSDYEKTIQHQMDLHLKKLDALGRLG